jgi:hypothetical protein
VSEPFVGQIVHVIHQMHCTAAIVVDVNSEGGAEVQEFPPLLKAAIGPDGLPALPTPSLEPYVALKSARPTSGWHHLSEHA